MSYRTGSTLQSWTIALLLLLLPAPLLAQTATLSTLSEQLTLAEKDIRAVDRALDARQSESDRRLLLTRTQAARAAAGDVASQLADQLARIDAKLAGLGPADDTAAEAADIRRQRSSLSRQRSAVDSAIKRGNLLAVEAQQLADEIAQSQAEQLSEKLSARSYSPLSPGFWTSIAKAFPRDFRRVAIFAGEGRKQVRDALRMQLPWTALAGLILSVVILIPGQAAARLLGRKLLTEGTPGHRVRRSGNALWRVLVGTIAPLLAGLAFVQGLKWAELIPGGWTTLLETMVAAAAFSGFTSAVMGALLMRSQPSWRIAPISDQAATRLRPFSMLLAALAFIGIMMASFNTSVGASAAATAATQAAFALLHILLIGAVLLILGRLRAARIEEDEDADRAHAGSGLVNLVAWILVGVASLALLLGYFSLSLFLLQMTAWAVVLGSAVYLVMTALDDVTTSLFNRSSAFGTALVRSLGLKGSAVDQFGVLLSGIGRLAIAVIALGMLLSPFGAGNMGTIFGRLGVLTQGFEVGGVAISPGAILRGIIVLFIGLTLVRGFMRWLDGRYLPATDLDGSGRNSVSLVARYVGIAIAIIWGLASLGIGIERIAILLSALSVGIGFGLQAITQNFVSGLILLAERPIKIGDLVRVGNDEGDVKRISVRSTEIELGDHSTLIVPNSELITKSVLNKTMSSPLGRVQIQFSVPIETDIDTVRAILLASYEAESAILTDPAPSIFIDSIVDGRIIVNSFAHVASPRASYGARSNVFMTLLRRFRDEDIEIGTIPQRLELVQPPAPAP
ncbi:MAG: DUF3772 domain-containing protein [Sphingobium sp.]